ncbi:class I SAM-dependent methyltransferase [Luteimicrobium xylanilyticum]|uniref:2-polyprenyl-6-hydroxyphenol methylase n=1 Tax=Luteimicrobium xylanilyticum TaxID=1133546 RepID=A0A5P9Q956_9MICO|nr:class I SAM-dependent methyltransferase [Luteimicrobium xylanilyticum]QFU97592.1 2-polyprenyl-6-hydroxyphenol methylase [Luteimicrobium xylanilyticum]
MSPTTPTLSDDDRTALYDAQNVWAADDDFFLALVGGREGSRVLDLGCGTGRLTLALAAEGHRVTGIDPDDGAVAAARRKPGADAVVWVVGTSEQIPPGAGFDTALMTSHVAQAITDEGMWHGTLDDLHAALVPGGLLAFDSRDPAVRAWERWTPERSRGRAALPDGTSFEGWHEVMRVEETGPDGGPTDTWLVHLAEHALLPDGTHAVDAGELVFRSEARLRADLAAAGFVVEQVHGGWERQPVGEGVGELVVLARRV